MGGLSHLFDFNHGSMARKVLAQKRLDGGFEAPRNSLELPVEASQSYSAVGDNTQYLYQDEWPVNTYQTEASMKKLISEEISKRANTRHKAPSVVARLMGMDMIPIDSKPLTQQYEKKNEKQRINFLKHDQNTKVSGDQVHGNSNYSGQREFDPFQLNKDRDTNHQCVGIKVRKPKSREHPQEEELQKFKKEFQEWQAARFRECSNGIEPGRIPSQWLAQETLNREKFALHANSSRTTGSEYPFEMNRNEVKSRSQDGGMLKNQGSRKEHFSSEPEGPYSLRSRTLSRDSEQFPLMDSGPRLDMFSAPTRIVILRPGPEQINDNEGSWVSSLGISEERGSIEDFLEEVKERLKYELQGKSKRGNSVRGGGIETPYREKPSEPKQIAQCIAKQVRENVTRDLGINLLRSESTRSSRGEIQHNGPGCPEFINKDARRVLAERLRNVIKGETDLHVPTAASGGPNPAMLDKMRGRRGKSVGDLKAGGELNCWDILEGEPEMQTKSFRHGPNGDVMHHRDLSPRNLSRSLSAPVSGTSFGKLLLEDRHILTGAHIRRKHEAIESVTVDVRKHKRERFNFKEKVSSFKYSFTLRGRLFRRKIQFLEKPQKNESDSKKDITSGLTDVMNFGERHENYTEVPPSPASVCSSVREESWRAAEHLSSASTSDISPLEDSTVPRVFKEISHNLNELRMQLKELEGDNLKETVVEEQNMEAEMELEDEAEAYIRDLLVASGLYESSADKVLSRWDPFAKPISTEIFEEVEESYRKMIKDHEESKGDEGEIRVNRKLLLDLANEALSIILGPPVTISRFRTKAISPTPRPPLGRNLLDCVWVIVRAHLYPPTDKTCYSLDDMLARDLTSTPWSGLMNEEIDALGKDMESHIIRDLIKEIVKDICQKR